MAERIHKLQPDRTIALRGYDDLGASAALHSATPEGFTVSGTFRDPGDFAVLMLWDADNFYEHPRIKYLPDTNFAGIKLQFDVHYSGLMNIDSPKFPTIDWPNLNVIRGRDENIPKSAAAQAASPDPYTTSIPVRLFDHAVRVGGTHTRAQGSFTLAGAPRQYDRLTLFYEDLAFDTVVPEKQWSFLCQGKGTPGAQHTVTVSGTPYTYTETAGDNNTTVTLGVIAALSSCPKLIAAQDAQLANQVNITAALDDGVGFDVNAFGTACPYLLHGWGLKTVAADLAGKINTASYGQKLVTLRATSDGPALTMTAQSPGEHGNLVAVYAVWKNENLRCTEHSARFTGGSSDATWRVTLDFSSLGLTNLRQMWLTFAPKLSDGAPYQDTEWEATFTNWRVTGDAQWLSVAGPASVRVEDSDRECTYKGEWKLDTGFYSEGFARITTQPGASVRVRYTSMSPHDLWLGTVIHRNGGEFSVSLDGDNQATQSCYLQVEPVSTRIRVRSNVAPGDHIVTITALGAQTFHFDFIEAVVASDIPPPLAPNNFVSPAMDYSTDHTWKLPPARIHWGFDQLGFAGPMNEYIGVFWWNQRKRINAVMPSKSVTFVGPFAAGDEIELRLEAEKPDDSHFRFRKVVYATETNQDIAAQLAQYINGYSVGVWARAEGAQLTVVSRSAKPAYRFPFGIRRKGGPEWSSHFRDDGGDLEAGSSGTWVVDPAQSPALNRGARDWHADMFRECQRRNREITVATSMELVNPPAGFGAQFFDGTVVETDVGFGSIKSTHCHFGAAMRDYQKSVYSSIADLMVAAGITPNLQFGEYLWWFFGWYTRGPNDNVNAGMAYYDAETKAAALTALGRPLVRFMDPNDDPMVNGGADARFLRNRLRDHVAALVSHIRAGYPGAQLEVLFPYDVNYPSPAGIHNLGGRLNRFVNLPVEWESKATAGFDRMKTEALDFGAWCRDLDLSRTAIELPMKLGWPADSVRHLTPIFRPGYAWQKEVDISLGKGLPVVNLWAWDHICLHGLPVGEQNRSRSFQLGD